MHQERLDLEALTQRLRTEGPFVTIVDGQPYRVLAAQVTDALSHARNNWLIALRVDTEGRPANNQVVTLNNGATMAAGPYRMAICHPLSVQDLTDMALSVHGRPGWHALRRCVSWAARSAWYHGVEPPAAEVDDLLRKAYETEVLWTLMGTKPSLEYLAWYAAGRDPQRLSFYFDLALFAEVTATHPTLVAI